MAGKADDDGGNRAEEEDEGERFRLLVDGVRDYAIFMLDPAGKVLTWNSGAELNKGYKAHEIIGQHFSRFYPADALNRGLPDHELKVAAAEGRYEDEGWRVRKDGTTFWANVVITALRSPSGRLRGFAKVTRDLSVRRAHEEVLRQSEERFRLLLEGVSDYAIFMLDANGFVATWNAGAQRIKGYHASEIIGQHFRKFYPPEALASGWPEHELEVAALQGRMVDEGWRLRKDGEKFWAHVTLSALRGDDGKLRGFAKLTRDLTERKRAEEMAADSVEREAMLEAERTARMSAQRAARIKDEFLARLSHELRTPLNAILGWTQIMKMGASSKAPVDYQRGVEVIDRNARSQARMVEDLLDLNKVMSGRLRLDLQQVHLGDIVSASVDSVEPTAHTKGVKLERILDFRGGMVSGDASRLQQICWNLLTNAVKFTPPGGTIQVLLQSVNSRAELRISDTGAGIAADFLPHIFERFSQADSSTTRRYSGLGLGLAVSKQLVELHGGSIQARSMGEGLGATFIVNFPLTIPDAENANEGSEHASIALAADPDAVPALKGIRALVVDDESDTLEVLCRVLENQGVKVSAASSAKQALELLAISTPDVIISDIGMPGVDGYQFMRRIRAQESAGQKIPALALTAFARPEDRQRSILAGYQAHLAKPFEVSELVVVVAGLVGKVGQGGG
jgi:PAS domain S-box-containing protein